MLTIANIVKKYGRLTVLDGLSVDFPDQGIHLIVGLNGSGKTTLLNIVCGLIQPTSGTITVNGDDNSARRAKECVFYMPSDFFLPEYLTGSEYGELVIGRYPNGDMSVFVKLMTIFDLSSYANSLIAGYSFGMKKKLQLAIMAASGASYVIGDEICSGLDCETMIIAHELIEQMSHSACVILVTHDAGTVNRFSDHIFLLRDGGLLPFSGDFDHLIEYVSGESEMRGKLDALRGVYSSR